ncbi:hypothetical protein FGSG_13985 [Fusarium graminearum PH-1]|uniref:hypothetical protein n=1 Tax=Gibberella zeae (strain ATCC MYA-4620 / CBS 123657 / FGSC 9075 / NRRL 31084 / PH-1) TaxID=229533 RepID=UPI00021F13CF|nr:hypothetical protein FGSG_13985 [Fusarium graminearum PH-1]ESU18280.1 hypothetical protein FGSG_13985 [Fusarium graminearum PH-1]|eukprot:XP_011325902.1 hypothetical protein FGSG_13985 [Fusarium graminearum PH-1]
MLRVVLHYSNSLESTASLAVYHKPSFGAMRVKNCADRSFQREQRRQSSLYQNGHLLYRIRWFLQSRSKHTYGTCSTREAEIHPTCKPTGLYIYVQKSAT